MFGRGAIPETTPTAADERADTDLMLHVCAADQWAGGHTPGIVV